MTQITTNPADFITAWNSFRTALPPAPKSSTNPHFKNKFAPLDTWIDAALVASRAANFSLLESVKLLVVDGVVYQVHVVEVIGEHGSNSSEYLIGEVDKPQAMGSALTYARRYHLQTVLGAVGEEDDDAEIATTRVSVPMGAGRQRRGSVA